MYKTLRGFSGSKILRNLPLKFPIPIVWDMTGCKNTEFLLRKCSKISKKLHGGDRRHIKVCQKKISKNQQMSNFSPLC